MKDIFLLVSVNAPLHLK